MLGCRCNLMVVTDIAQGRRRPWIVVLARLPAEPARHRMALWRELRRSGAIPLGQAIWAVPDLPAVRPLLERVSDIVEMANGTLLLLSAQGLAEADVARLEQLYAAARQEEWFEAYADQVYAALNTPPPNPKLVGDWMSAKEGAGR